MKQPKEKSRMTPEKEMRNMIIRDLSKGGWKPGRIAAVMHIARSTVMNVLGEKGL